MYETSKTLIITAKVEDTGVYKCSVKSGIYSNPVRLHVISGDYLILQAPSDIIEGDSLSLRCHNWPKYKARGVKYFYKDNELSGSTDDILHIPNVNTSMSGTYKCEKYFDFFFQDKWKSAEKYIYVQDLFSAPEIKNYLNSVREGDPTTFTCNTKRNPLRGGTDLHFAFYRDGRTVRGYNVSDTYRVRSFQLEDSGKYTCEVRTVSDTVRKMSDGIYIHIHGLLTLQTPSDVIEGDNLSLRCHSEQKYETGKTIYYYKNEKTFNSTGDLYIPNVTTAASGRYHCAKYFRDIKTWIYTAVTFISVKELFPTPEIQTSPSSVQEGDEMMVTCHTTLNPLRGDTELHFAFHRDGRTVREFGISNTYRDGRTVRGYYVSDTYRVPSSQLKDSGNYTCEVRTASDTVRKMSNEINIQIYELFSPPKIKVTPSRVIEGREMTVRCDTRIKPLRGGTELHFSFYRDGRTVREYSISNTYRDGWAVYVSDTYKVTSAKLEDSGKYTCEVRTTSDTVRKDSNAFPVPVQIQELFTSPEIRVGPSLLVEEGEQVTLECVTDPKGSTNLLYTFYKDSQIVQSADRKTSYVIGKAGEENSGSYQCSVQSRDGKVIKNSTDVHILVQSPISGVSITVDKGHFVYGESLTLNCSVEKGTSPVFLWLHNEMVVDQDSKFYQLLDNGTVLYIQSLQSHHAGTYRCQVSNKLSASKPSFVVKTFQISQITEKLPPGSNVLWPVLGVLLLMVLLVIILLVVKRRKLPSLFPSLNRQQNQQISEPTFDKDRPR
ncbi:Fc receptor-like protein 5 [Rana temporaria]|uniref:Fc receptor-like protein 5 n=1 Tax=Rana temporaria TaxID=8407 RepID=UPI001AAE0218|nr:Fc receptor-like protein 5 [Rana temporaria]